MLWNFLASGIFVAYHVIESRARIWFTRHSLAYICSSPNFFLLLHWICAWATMFTTSLCMEPSITSFTKRWWCDIHRFRTSDIFFEFHHWKNSIDSHGTSVFRQIPSPFRFVLSSHSFDHHMIIRSVDCCFHGVFFFSILFGRMAKWCPPMRTCAFGIRHREEEKPFGHPHSRARFS